MKLYFDSLYLYVYIMCHCGNSSLFEISAWSFVDILSCDNGGLSLNLMSTSTNSTKQFSSI